MCIEITQQLSFKYLLEKNEKFIEVYKKNALMQLVYDDKVLTVELKNKLLDCIQILSNYFQKVVMLRDVFSEIPGFCEVTQAHLSEEFGHHMMLMKDRKNRPCVWDAVLEATSAWFAWKMFMLDNEEKTVLVHLVLEASGNLFFQAAHKVMHHYGETEYFKIHSEADERHENMGKALLSNLSTEKYARLLEVQKQGWDMVNAACNRIAEISVL